MHNYKNIYYFIDEFNKKELLKLDKKISIIYRNYTKKNIDTDVLNIKEFCKNSGNKFYLSNNKKKALKYNADGLYIPSFNRFKMYKNSIYRKSFKIIGSAHNVKEVREKVLQGCTTVFISPVFKNKGFRSALGVAKLNKITINSKINFIALGGINKSNIKRLNMTNVCGIASISWIKKNRPKFN
ncbi:MAG: thiamine phosphate synthase [Candidatus Pelagibacter sp.]|tara:strand:+ start:157 stop:708 length:552 start_codon:yes stop_codon:yes gene_type:complete